MSRLISANSREAVQHTLNGILQEQHCCCYCREGSLQLHIGNRGLLLPEGTAILIQKRETVSLTESSRPFLLDMVPVPSRLYTGVRREHSLGMPLFNVPFSIPDDRSLRSMFLDVLHGKLTGKLLADNSIVIATMQMLLAGPTCQKEGLQGALPVVNGRKGVLAAQFSRMVQQAEQVHNVSYYAGQLCVSEGYLAKCLKTACLPPPKKYIMAALLEKALPLLSGGQHSITAISELLGFESPSGFTSFFTSYTGLSPSAYRRKYL